MEKILNYIDGKLIAPVNGKFEDNISPITGKAYSQVPCSNEADVHLAVEAAVKAKDKWNRSTLKERKNVLRKLADGINKNFERLAQAETIDNGKPIGVSRAVDIPRSATNLEFYSDILTSFNGNYFQTDQFAHNITMKNPLGIVACISPWNLPLYLMTWKLAPALATGNCTIVKPSEVTPMTAYLFSKICQEADLPPGILSILHGKGPEVGTPMVTHKDIKAVSFTGSTATGRVINQLASQQFKKVSLEMGGKNPTIIFEDCDFEKTVSGAVRASFSNQGQICLCGSRILVQKSIYNKFKESFLEKAQKLKVGDPRESTTHVGALVSKLHYEKVLSHIDLAKKEGGTLLLGGNKIDLGGELSGGYYIAPTVFENLSQSCQTNMQEIFGPMVTLQSFETEEEAIALSNATQYGLSSSVWTQNINRAMRVSREIQSGIVWVNTWMMRDLRTPFGGMKESGMGREGGEWAFNFFTEPKNICFSYDQESH
ncbi:MAG: 5-carboxymethyl-2-hydroxymuconate semialdehyde dehydrogenase [Bdellovibrio sp.]